MWNIKLALDIMGGGASAPDNIPINTENKTFRIVMVIALTLIAFLVFSAILLNIINLFQNHKNSNIKTNENENVQERK